MHDGLDEAELAGCNAVSTVRKSCQGKTMRWREIMSPGSEPHLAAFTRARVVSLWWQSSDVHMVTGRGGMNGWVVRIVMGYTRGYRAWL